MGITLLLCALAVFDQIMDPPVERDLLGALVVLAFGWAGFGADTARQWLGR